MGRIGGGCLLMCKLASSLYAISPRYPTLSCHGRYRCVDSPGTDHIHRYENKVKDYNFGSLIRTDARKEYAEDNTIFGASPQLISPVFHRMPVDFYIPVTRMQVISSLGV